MPNTAPDLAHLVALMEAARAEAERLGPAAETFATRLAALAQEAGSLTGRGGKPDQGTRLGDLTTANDQ